MPFIFWLRR